MPMTNLLCDYFRANGCWNEKHGYTDRDYVNRVVSYVPLEGNRYSVIVELQKWDGTEEVEATVNLGELLGFMFELMGF